MDPSVRYPTSGTRLVAAPGDDQDRIVQALSMAESHVARMPPSQATQQLKSVLEASRRAIARWSTSPPTNEEVQEVRDRVVQTLQVAKTTSPTLRFRRAG